MNITSKNLKLVIGATYLIALFTVLYFVFSFIDVKDLKNYEFIRSYKESIFQYKNNNLFLLTVVFFIFSIIWILLLGFAGPILLFAGFVYGKWFGILIVLTATTIGATLLYVLAGLFRDLIREKLEHRFSNLKVSLKKMNFYFSNVQVCRRWWGTIRDSKRVTSIIRYFCQKLFFGHTNWKRSINVCKRCLRLWYRKLY